VAIPWHRIFGMALTQYFAGTGWKVDVEVDLSLQQQRLDLVILRHITNAPQPQWPDGFGTPAEYNLFTFKALRDPLDVWALKELRRTASTTANTSVPISIICCRKNTSVCSR
jgi:hypothetical protein